MRRFRRVPPIAAAVVAVAGGAWIGFSSCGGYSWHRHAIVALLALSVLATFLLPPAALRSGVRRLVFSVGIVALLAIAAGSASLFYPSTPTWTEFMQKLPGSIAGERC